MDGLFLDGLDLQRVQFLVEDLACGAGRRVPLRSTPRLSVKNSGGRSGAAGGGGGVGTRPRYLIVCLWRRLLASRHCSF